MTGRPRVVCWCCRCGSLDVVLLCLLFPRSLCVCADFSPPLLLPLLRLLSLQKAEEGQSLTGASLKAHDGRWSSE